jgi:hypothetical protein
MRTEPAPVEPSARLTRLVAGIAPIWLIALFVLSLPAVNVRLYASDEVQYFAFLRSLWFDRDVSFDNEYRYLYEHGVAQFDGFRETFLENATETGLRINFGTMGPAVLWAPFYGVADLSVIAGRALGWNLTRDGYSWPYLAAVCYGSAFYGFAAVLLSARFARRLTGLAIGPAVAVWIGTPLLFYMYLAAGMAHAVSAFAVALMLTTWLSVREKWTTRGAVALGAIAGLIVMVREQDVVLLAGPIVDYGRYLVGRARARGLDLREEIHVPIAALAAFVGVYLPQLLAYLSLNDRPGPSRLVTRKLSWWSPHGLQVLLSPEHGFVFWTPLAVIAVVGLVLVLRRRDRVRSSTRAEDAPPAPIAFALLLSFAAHVYISGCVDSWTVAGAFGQRRFVAVTAILVAGIAAAWQHTPAGRPRWMAGALIALTVWWNLGLMALFGARMMDRQRLELRRNAYDVFITLPRVAPSLAYRYVFERQSFYQSPGANR